MTAKASIKWFKTTFHETILTATAGTPFSVDLLTAIAYQETGYVWGRLIGQLPLEDLLKTCVGDTIDKPRRGAFPLDKADLLKAANGAQMFKVAREALGLVAPYDKAYDKQFKNDPDKFCHGYGIFQYDLQFFKEKSPATGAPDPDFFLKKKWHRFENCLAILLAELKSALREAYGAGKTSLTDEESVYVAIAYNHGSVKVGDGFKQGHQDNPPNGKYYGENIANFLQIAHGVKVTPAPEGFPSSAGDQAAESLWESVPSTVPATGFCLHIQRVRQEKRAGRGPRTIGNYQAYWNRAPIASLQGQMVETTGPSDNGAAGKDRRRIEAKKYPLAVHGTAKYKTVGYKPGNQPPRPCLGLVLEASSPRDGILIHPCHEAAGYLSSIGCLNPASGLKNAASRINLMDSFDRTAAIINALAERLGNAFPRSGKIPRACVVIEEIPA